jgi:sirohydrochlorin ferrochelatase
MRRAVVIVDHGSRVPEAHAHLERIATEVRRLAPGVGVYVGHMDLARPSLDEALEACARDGASDVVVHPLFLVPGRHLSEDIPKLVARAAGRHPGVRIRVSRPLGSATGLAELIVRTALDESGEKNP